jgi:hypothetical protein
MKKIILGIVITACNCMNSQGIGLNDELKLDRKFALHTEIGLMTTPVISTQIDNSQTTYLTTYPYCKIEPRYYYGLDRRTRLNRNTANNSSNYIAINTSYLSINNAINHKEEKRNFSGLLIAPNYGIRRSFDQSFYFESSFGIAVAYTILNKDSNYIGDIYQLLPYINVVLGVNF